MNSTIGFIGLGLLGGAMAQRLLASGYAVVGYNQSAEKTQALIAHGLQPAESAAEVARRCSVILVCVTDTAALSDVISGPNGVIKAGRLDQKILIDHSTSEIPTTRQLAESLRESTGMGFVDAPVSGGPGAALTGSLSIMAGGSDENIKTVRAVMETLGRFTHMGPIGAGQATKLVNQALVLPAYCVMAEALRLAQAYGVDASKVPHALETGHAGSNLLPVLFERMIAENYTPTGYARQILKDLEMLHSASKEQNLAMPMSSQTLNMFRMLVAQGHGELDGSAILTLLPDPRSTD